MKGGLFLASLQPLPQPTRPRHLRVRARELRVEAHIDAWLEELTRAASSNALGPLIHEVSGAASVDFVPSFDNVATTIVCARLGCKMGPSLDYRHVRRQLTFLRSLCMLPPLNTPYGELPRFRRLTGELQRIPTEVYLKMQFGSGPNKLRQTIQKAGTSVQRAANRPKEIMYKLRLRRVERVPPR